MKMRSSIISCALGLAAFAIGLVPACGSDSGGQSGATGGSTNGGGQGGGAATNPGGANGTGATSPGGSSPGGGAAGTSGGVAGAGATGAGGSAATNAKLGLTCATAADCGAGLICLTPMGTDFDGGGVANGLCTFDCSQDLANMSMTSTVCDTVSSTAVCLQVSDTKAYCVESCNEGPVSSIATKCHGRRDMACSDPNDTGFGYCAPTCRGDSDCAGRTCDLGSGTCTGPIAAARKLPQGAKCDPNATTDICEGSCIGILEGTATTSTVGFCSGFCRLGELGCGVAANATTADSACLFPVSEFGDLGDLGFCAELCDCNSDCKNPDFLCSAVAGLMSLAGHVGACGPASGASGDGGVGLPCGKDGG